jgi:hypothetical protein
MKISGIRQSRCVVCWSGDLSTLILHQYKERKGPKPAHRPQYTRNASQDIIDSIQGRIGFAAGELEEVWSTYGPRLVRAVHSLNRTGKGRKRWNSAFNVLAITFEGRILPTGTRDVNSSHTSYLTVPVTDESSFIT